MDSGDFDSYAKLYRSYDALRKSLKFTEAQNKEDKAGEFDAVGAIEKEHEERYKLLKRKAALFLNGKLKRLEILLMLF